MIRVLVDNSLFFNPMRLLWNYLKNYKKLLTIALALATINQVFSLFEPLIFRQLIDRYASKIGLGKKQAASFVYLKKVFVK
jgi:ATP-binding cassette subfamily B protein